MNVLIASGVPKKEKCADEWMNFPQKRDQNQWRAGTMNL